MARTVSAATRQELLEAVRERYQCGFKSEKRRILDELVGATRFGSWLMAMEFR